MEKSKSFIVSPDVHQMVKKYCDKYGYKIQSFVEKTLIKEIKTLTNDGNKE